MLQSISFRELSGFVSVTSWERCRDRSAAGWVMIRKPKSELGLKLVGRTRPSH
jgi:hypothetical protein